MMAGILVRNGDRLSLTLWKKPLHLPGNSGLLQARRDDRALSSGAGGRTVLTRRQAMGTTGLAALSAAGLVSSSRRAKAESFVFKCGSTLSGTHPAILQMRAAADRLRDATNGQVEVKVFPDSALGGDGDMLSQVRSGALESLLIAGLITSTLVPTAAINGMGFAFADYATVWKAMDGDVGAVIRAALEKAHLVVMDQVWDNGFRQITSSATKIETPHDLVGLKLRVPVSPLYTSMFRKLGVGPTGLSLGETYSALQTHLVDGQENPLVVVETTKFYEVQKYCAMTNHIWDGLWLLISPRVWSRLPADLQQTTARIFNEAAIKQRQDVAALNASLKDKLMSRGMVFTSPAEAPFREALQSAGFYAEWKAKFSPEAWGALEKYVGKLA
jgi:tripartite ATP-independent transporter DctP family solute receptor